MMQSIKSRIKDRLSKKRYEHSLAVAQTAKELAGFWGENPEKSYLTGLLHDLGKELSLEDMLDKLKDSSLFSEERKSKELLHARVGAILAQQEFHIDDSEILRAIEEHTLGGEKMSLLSKILYVSDYISPDRNHDGVEKARKLAYQDLDQTILFILDHTLEYLKKKQIWIHPRTEKVKNQILLYSNERRINELDGKRSAISK